MPNEAQSVASQVFVTDSHAVAWRPSQFAANVGVKDLGTANDRTMQFVRFRNNVVCPEWHSVKNKAFIINGLGAHGDLFLKAAIRCPSSDMGGFRAQSLLCLWKTRFAPDERTSSGTTQVVVYKNVMLN